MNIGQISKASGLPNKTIRYYEDIGLITPERGANGYRRFAETDLRNLQFIARARWVSASMNAANCFRFMTTTNAPAQK